MVGIQFGGHIIFQLCKDLNKRILLVYRDSAVAGATGATISA